MLCVVLGGAGGRVAAAYDRHGTRLEEETILTVVTVTIVTVAIVTLTVVTVTIATVTIVTVTIVAGGRVATAYDRHGTRLGEETTLFVGTTRHLTTQAPRLLITFATCHALLLY